MSRSVSLDAVGQALYEAARKAQARAHVPYSRFPVGAAILADDGEIYAGCNVENAAYPVGACAEASAISVMVSAGAGAIRKILVVGKGAAAVTPCGGCRQRIREFAAPETPVYCCGGDGDEVLEFTLEELLPASFGPDHLEAAR
jgi:cytidine deaminase